MTHRGMDLNKCKFVRYLKETSAAVRNMQYKIGRINAQNKAIRQRLIEKNA